jgi:hypothetical protein
MSDFFSAQMSASVPPSEVREATLESLARPLAGFGFRLTAQSSAGMTFQRRYMSWSTLILVVLFFPLGLALLFTRGEQTISMSFEPDGDGTRIVVAGEGPAKVRNAFAELAATMGTAPAV